MADAIHPVMAGTADVAIMESPPTGVPGTRTVRLPDHKLRLVCPPGTPPPVDGVFIGEDLMRIGLVVAPRFETSDVYRHLRSIEPRIDHAFVMRSQHRDAFADFRVRRDRCCPILELSSAERASERGCTVGEISELPPRKIAAVARDGQNTQIVDISYGCVPSNPRGSRRPSRSRLCALGIRVARASTENDDFVHRHNTSGIVRFLKQSDGSPSREYVIRVTPDHFERLTFMRKSLKTFRECCSGGALCATLGLTGAAGTAAADAPGIPSVGHDWASAGPYTPNVSIGLVHTLYYPAASSARAARSTLL